ncbi:MAG: HEAT repeat domain-containing protein [Candidatus Odinarchaeota archaeon]
MERNSMTLEKEAFLVKKKALNSSNNPDNTRTVDQLLESIDDENPEVRKLVIEALGETDDPRAIQKLNEVIVSVENFTVCERQLAKESLVKIGNPALEYLITLLEDRNKDVNIRIRVAVALGSFDASRAVSTLISILNDGTENSTVRRYASHALGNIGDQLAVKPLIDLLRGETGKGVPIILQISAAGALGKIGGKHAIEALIAALGDDNIGIQEQSLNSLQLLGTVPIGPLISFLHQEKSITGDSNHLFNALKALAAITPPPLSQESMKQLKTLEPLFLSLILEPSADNRSRKMLKTLLSRIVK